MANWLSFSGNLTSDPELHEFKTGSKVCRFDLAHNVRYQDADGNWQDGVPIYITCEARGFLADRVKDNLLRGNPVIVEGTLSAQEWEDKETGQMRRKNILKVRDIAFDIRFHNIEATKASPNRDNPPVLENDHAPEQKPASKPKAKAKPARKAKPKAKVVDAAPDSSAGVAEQYAEPEGEYNEIEDGADKIEKDDLF